MNAASRLVLTAEEKLANAFPQLNLGEFEVTSDCDARYNCIAWAMGDNRCWWWPARVPVAGQCWPAGAPSSRTIDAFRAAFALLGYQETSDHSYEPGKEKVAIFVNDRDEPTHAAYLSSDGRWSSKLGRLWDIHHDRLEGVGGGEPGYGRPELIMVRRDALEGDAGLDEVH